MAVEVLFNSTEPEKHSISYSPWTRSAPGGSCPMRSKDTVRAMTFCATHSTAQLLARAGSYQVQKGIVEWMKPFPHSLCKTFFTVSPTPGFSCNPVCFFSVLGVWYPHPFTPAFSLCSLAHSIHLLFKVQFSSHLGFYSLSRDSPEVQLHGFTCHVVVWHLNAYVQSFFQDSKSTYLSTKWMIFS